MKTIKFLLLILLPAITLPKGYSENTNSAVLCCDANISISLKESGKQIKTNGPVMVTVKVTNLSTNEILMFRIENLPNDFKWTITSPSGKDVSPKHDALHEAISGWFPKLNPMEFRESDYDLSDLFCFTEVGIYKITAEKQVACYVAPPIHKKCEITSNPLAITFSK